MGCYINPLEGSKEQFLAAHGTLLPIPDPALVPAGYVPVCWVDNQRFTAAGIAFDEDEMKEFLRDMTGRAHQWFIVPVEVVKRVSTLETDPNYKRRFEQGRFS